MGKLPWVINDKDGVPVGAFRTRALRRLVARYLRVVAGGTLPGSGKGLGGAVEKIVWGKGGWSPIKVESTQAIAANPGDVIVGEYKYSRCRMNAEGRLRRVEADADAAAKNPHFVAGRGINPCGGWCVSAGHCPGYGDKKPTGMYAGIPMSVYPDATAAKRLLADVRRLANNPKVKVELARECEKYTRGKGARVKFASRGTEVIHSRSNSLAPGD